MMHRLVSLIVTIAFFAATSDVALTCELSQKSIADTPHTEAIEETTKKPAAPGFTEPKKPNLIKFAHDHLEKLPQGQREPRELLIRKFMYIEGFSLVKNALALFGVLSTAAVAATAGLTGPGAWAFSALIVFSFGIARSAITFFYCLKHPDFKVPNTFYLFTLFPLGAGFVYSALSLALPGYTYRDLRKFRDIEHKLKGSLHHSDLWRDLEREEMKLLNQRTLDIAADILKYQKEHFDDPLDPKHRRLFRIRSAEWNSHSEKRTYHHLMMDKRFLFIDSAASIEKVKTELKEKFGSDYLKRIYFYDMKEFLKDASAGNQKETYVKHLFPTAANSAAAMGNFQKNARRYSRNSQSLLAPRVWADRFESGI